MSYTYSHLQQGYTGSGGVPYNGMPTLPPIVTSKRMEEHLPAIASMIYADMNRRNTQVTTYLTSAMAVNTYHNETFTLALQLSVDYVEYLTGAKMLPLPQAINTAVPLVNDYICFNYVSQAPNARQMASQQELSTYSVAAEKIKSLKPEIKNYLTRGDTNVYPQYPNQGYPMPAQYPQAGYPTQGQPPVGVIPHGYPQQYPQPGFPSNPNNPNGANALLTRALARSGIGPAPQPVPQPAPGYYPGQPPVGVVPHGYPQQYPNQGYPQQGFPPGYNPTMQTAQAVQQAWGQPQYNQGYNPAAFAAPTPTQNPVGMQRPPVQNYPNSVQNSGNIWTANPNMMTSAPQQQPLTSRPVSQPYVPDMSAVARPQQPTQPTQPVQPKPVQQPVAQPAPNFSHHIQQRTPGYQPAPSPAGTLMVDPELTRYEQRVREFAKQKGLPWNEQSIEALEWAITNMYPDNGFIDPNNPYRLRSMPNAQPVKPLASQQEVSQYIQRTATDDLREMASKSKGELVKQPNGDYVWLKEAGNPNSAVNYVSVTSQPEAIRNHFSNGKEPPYPFAKLNSKGEWFINEAEFNKLPKDKRPMPYDGAIARCLMRDIYFIVDDNGVVQNDFSSIKPEYQQEYEELLMNKEQHDYTRFFSQQTARDAVTEIDYTKAIEAFASAQTQSKVDELIAELEADSNAVKENGVLQISDRTLQSPRIVSGEILGDDYVAQAQTILDEYVENKAEVTNCAVRFVHANLSGNLQTGELAQVARGLINCTTWKQIIDVINELDSFANTGIATVLNQRATNYINQQLISMFNIYPTDFYMESFLLDILDVEEEMESRELATEFNKLATKLVLSLLYCFDSESNLFKSVIGEMEVEDGTVLTSFGIVRDVTVLPIHSSFISLNSEKRRAVVTEGSAPQLYELIKKTLDTAHPRAAEVLLVTNDNRIMYVNRTANSKAFAVTQNSVLEETIR